MAIICLRSEVDAQRASSAGRAIQAHAAGISAGSLHIEVAVHRSGKVVWRGRSTAKRMSI